MRFLFLSLLVFFISSPSFSGEISQVKGNIQDIFCGEMDPEVVGAACVLFTTDENSEMKFGLWFEGYEWIERFVADDRSYEEYLGDRFELSGCQTLSSSQEVYALKTFSPEPFYVKCSVDHFFFTPQEVE